MPNLIGRSPNQVPVNGMLGTAAFVDLQQIGGVKNVLTATTATTLTSTPTLLQITPSSYGVAVTLPNATTCPLGGPLHKIANRGDYPVKLLNSAGTLIGFVFAGVTSDVALVNNSTAAGVWDVSNVELASCSAALSTANITTTSTVIDLGGSQEMLVGKNASNNCYAVVYNRVTNTFGSVTLVRSGALQDPVATLAGANAVLVVTCNTTTEMEAVVLTVSGTTITVNTAATVTLSATGYPSYLVAVGSSFVVSYLVGTPARQIRSMTISGTTVTIGTATVLSGTDSSFLQVSGSVVVAFSGIATVLYVTPYTISGTTITIGTGATISGGYGCAFIKVFTTGTGRLWCVMNVAGAAQVAVATLTSTTITLSSATLPGAGTVTDAIVVTTAKVLVTTTGASNNVHLATDTAGTVSVGTALSIANSAPIPILLRGASVYVYHTTSGPASAISLVNCSGASPTSAIIRSIASGATAGSSGGVVPFFASNALLNKNTAAIFGSDLVDSLYDQQPGSGDIKTWSFRLKGVYVTPRALFSMGLNLTTYGLTIVSGRNSSDSERWTSDGVGSIYKFECVV